NYLGERPGMRVLSGIRSAGFRRTAHLAVVVVPPTGSGSAPPERTAVPAAGTDLGEIVPRWHVGLAVRLVTPADQRSIDSHSAGVKGPGIHLGEVRSSGWGRLTRVRAARQVVGPVPPPAANRAVRRSEEHTSELQSRENLVGR